MIACSKRERPGKSGILLGDNLLKWGNVVDLLRVSEVVKGKNFPMSRAWLYKCAHLRKHPKLLVKIGSSLFVDLDEFKNLAEAGRM